VLQDRLRQRGVRSDNMLPFSRLGPYDRSAFDRSSGSAPSSSRAHKVCGGNTDANASYSGPYQFSEAFSAWSTRHSLPSRGGILRSVAHPLARAVSLGQSLGAFLGLSVLACTVGRGCFRSRPLQTPALLRGGNDPLHTLCAHPAFGSWRFRRGWRQRLSLNIDPRPSRFLRQSHLPSGCYAELRAFADSRFLRRDWFDLRCRRGAVNIPQRRERPLDGRLLPFQLRDDAGKSFCHSLILPRVCGTTW
jgi:hypothetical protein